LAIAKESTPDILAEQLSKRSERLKSELEQLVKDNEGNTNLIKQKEEEIRSVQMQIEQLRQQLEQATTLLEDQSAELEYVKDKVDECPYCQTPLSAMNDVQLDEHTDGTVRSYACGFSELDGAIQGLCPADPRYPKLEDFELIARYNERSKQWFCRAEPKTAMARKLGLMGEPGSTEEEAKDRVIKRYNWWIDYHKSRWGRFQAVRPQNPH
jgi:hypothetical protein